MWGSAEFLSDTSQDALDELIIDTKLETLNMESSVENSYRGDTVYKVWKDADGEVHIDVLPAMMYFPHFKDNNIKEVDYIEICWMHIKGDKKYVQKEIHYKDRIKNKLFLIADDRNSGGEYTGNKEIEVDFSVIGMTNPGTMNNPTGEFLVIHIPNYRLSNYHFGISDIQSMTSLFNEADFRMTQLANILNKHADPKLAVPKGVLDAKGQVQTGNFQMFEVSNNNTSLNKPEYITWDARLEEVFKEIDLIAERVALFGRMPLGLFKQNENMTAPEAAKSLKLKFLMSLKKSNRKRLYYDTGLKQVLYVAGLLMDDGTDFEDVRIKWNDGLPEDRLEELQVMNLEKQTGVISQDQLAREHMHKKGMDQTQIDEQMMKIQKENTDVNAPGSTMPPVVKLEPKTEPK